MITDMNLARSASAEADAPFRRGLSRGRGIVPILRPPAFRGARPRGRPVLRHDPILLGGLPMGHMTAIAARMTEGRIGGDFWGQSLADGPAATILRPTSLHEARGWVRSWSGSCAPLIVSLPATGWARLAQLALSGKAEIVIGAVDPWSLIRRAQRVVSAPDDEIGLLAALAGVNVVVRSGDEILSRETLQKLALQRVHAFDYFDPFSGAEITIGQWIEILADWRRQIDDNRHIVAAWGVARWKRPVLHRFLWDGQRGHPPTATLKRPKPGDRVAIWPSRVSAQRLARAEAAGARIVRIEDGFIRSNGLGCHLHLPMSVAVDPVGIYYDPSRPSALEQMLAETRFDTALLVRAEALIARIVASGISKYGSSRAAVRLPHDRRCVLVAGQVEDDLSVQLGGGGVGNLDLLTRARAAEPNAFIAYKPHPDVTAGLRRGRVRDQDMLCYADLVVHDAPIARLIEQVDAVHVLTSLTGFEALLRRREVVTHGQPFYAGWGLTRDLAPAISRRGRVLSLEELVAGALILYPRYLDPETGLPCPAEILVERLAHGRSNRPGALQRLRTLQGKLTAPRLRLTGSPA